MWLHSIAEYLVQGLGGGQVNTYWSIWKVGVKIAVPISRAEITVNIWLRLWRRQWHPTPVLLPGKSHGWRSLEGRSPWGRWGLDTTEQLHFHFSLSCIGEENGNPLQCSCLENPREGEPVGCRPLGRTEQQHGQGTLQHTWHILIFIISCKYQYYPIFQIRKPKPSHAFPQDHMVTGKMATKQVLRIWLQRLYSVIYKVSHFWKVIQPLWASISISVTVKREEYLSLIERESLGSWF